MCPISLNQGRLTWRHISVLSMLLSRLHDDIIQNSIQGNLCRYFLYFFYIYLPLEGAFRPIFSPPANVMISSSLMLLKRIILMELTVPFEMNINDAHSRKMDRYRRGRFTDCWVQAWTHLCWNWSGAHYQRQQEHNQICFQIHWY